jgi:hypothetical protein
MGPFGIREAGAARQHLLHPPDSRAEEAVHPPELPQREPQLGRLARGNSVEECAHRGA